MVSETNIRPTSSSKTSLLASPTNPRTSGGSRYSYGMSCRQVGSGHNSGKHCLLALSHRISLFSIDILGSVKLCSVSLGGDIDSLAALVQVVEERTYSGIPSSFGDKYFLSFSS